MAVVLFIVALVAVPLAAIASQFFILPTEWQANVTAMRDAREAVKWVADDARQAACFEIGFEPDYGTLSWTDYTVSSPIRFNVRYFYESSTTSLIREEVGGDLTTTRPIIDTIAEYDDFWLSLEASDKADRIIRASAIATTESVRDTYQRTHDIAVMMRPSLLLEGCS
jgi:hypothetical protein